MANSFVCVCESETFGGVSDFMAVTFCEPHCGLLVNVSSTIRGKEDKQRVILTEGEGKEKKHLEGNVLREATNREAEAFKSAGSQRNQLIALILVSFQGLFSLSHPLLL